MPKKYAVHTTRDLVGALARDDAALKFASGIIQEAFPIGTRSNSRALPRLSAKYTPDLVCCLTCIFGWMSGWVRSIADTYLSVWSH